MTQTEITFNSLMKKHLDWSSAVCFNLAIDGKDISCGLMGKLFNRLVDKDDYDPEDRQDIVDNLRGRLKKAQ